MISWLNNALYWRTTYIPQIIMMDKNINLSQNQTSYFIYDNFYQHL